MSTYNLLTLGIAGGLVPCASALVLLRACDRAPSHDLWFNVGQCLQFWVCSSILLMLRTSGFQPGDES
ncbi:hypothetical protein OGM63_14310 [Plectonema radiosum NIES-515]|uniref:Uncharacterized protein n=1 Tax=Plectonema radiosum NIES-515 TaxID=2986073 RepID=A0ABT3B1B1_9CYAN|nr:hypothetical protein [Plectonema radiosum]MCV3214674.1 hypothetical protein [Plectonema radiosum NIES-515]